MNNNFDPIDDALNTSSEIEVSTVSENNLTKNEYNTYELDNPQPYLNFKITDIEDIENETERLINR